MATCSKHPLTPRHIQLMATLADAHLRAAKEGDDLDALSDAVELRKVVYAMLPDAEPKTRRRRSSQLALAPAEAVTAAPEESEEELP